MARFLQHVLVSAALFATPVSAIEGSYRVTGAGPGGANPHRGAAHISKNGTTYTVIWRIGASRHEGTGILLDDILSVVFVTSGPNASAGVASYRVVNGRVADGIWTTFGGREVGTERMEPDDVF